MLACMLGCSSAGLQAAGAGSGLQRLCTGPSCLQELLVLGWVHRMGAALLTAPYSKPSCL